MDQTPHTLDSETTHKLSWEETYRAMTAEYEDWRDFDTPYPTAWTE